MIKLIAVLAALAVVLGLVFWIYEAIKNSGRKEAEGEAAKKGVRLARKAIENSEKVARMSDDQLTRELRKWQRD